jgi:hypothetical protein
MRALIVSVALALASMSALAEPVSDKDMLQRYGQVRSRIQADEARANRQVGGPQLAPQAIDRPTVSQLHQQTANNLTRIENRFRCLDVEVKNTGNGITNIVCGDNTGYVAGKQTQGETIVEIGR